jgi:hypothetical protein
VRCCHPAGSAEVEQLARAICGDEQDAALVAHARIIAENELLRRAIRLQKLASVERLLAEARPNESEYVQQTIDTLVAKIFDKFKYQLPSLAEVQGRYSSSQDIFRAVEDYLSLEKLIEARKFVKEFLDQVEPPKVRKERTEYEAVELAASDLDALERYETRAHSRQMRAIREFIEIKGSAES